MQGAYTFFNLIAISFGKRDFFFLFIILQNLSLEQTKSRLMSSSSLLLFMFRFTDKYLIWDSFPLWILFTMHHYRTASRKGHSHVKCTSFNIRSRTSEGVVIFPVTGEFATFTKITLSFLNTFCIYTSRYK